MNILTRRLIGLAAAAAAAAYFVITHTIALDTYMNDQTPDDKKAKKNANEDKENDLCNYFSKQKSI